MNREKALADLEGGAPAERLTAARYLQFWALPIDIPALRSAIARESVGWVRRALESALTRLGDDRPKTVDLEDLSQDEGAASADLAALARARIARMVVHELEPIVGTIEYYATTEFGGYAGSQTQRQVDRLAALLRAIETLGTISTRPKLESTELPQLIRDIVEAEKFAFETEIRLEGPSVLSVMTDPSLLRLILANGLKNACESVIQVVDRAASVSVIFGATDRDYWVTVVDSGGGLPSGSTQSLFEMGTSTKEDHLGMGLALSNEAARALGGTLRLSSDLTGTRFELTVTASGGRP